MENKVVLTGFFLKKAKRLLKKYHTLQNSLRHLESTLIANPGLVIVMAIISIRYDLQMNRKVKAKVVDFGLLHMLLKKPKHQQTFIW
jgi:hypothetical protein